MDISYYFSSFIFRVRTLWPATQGNFFCMFSRIPLLIETTQSRIWNFKEGHIGCMSALHKIRHLPPEQRQHHVLFSPDFSKNLRASLFNDDISNEPNLGRVHLARKYGERKIWPCLREPCLQYPPPYIMPVITKTKTYTVRTVYRSKK